jgi:hypothetical protein
LSVCKSSNSMSAETKVPSTVLPWTPLMIQKMVQFVKFSSISPDGKNQQASIGSPDINRWLFLALPTPYP